MINRILCVAEKPSISKSVSEMLSGGSRQTVNTKNKFIKNYEFDAFYQGTDCRVVMTALLGHLMDIDFEPSFKSWKVNTLEQLFNARLVQTVKEDMKDLESNLKKEARLCQMLVIWTDCDREGENIGSEVAAVCRSVNPRIIVKRAKFSVVQNREIKYAWNNLVELDMNAASAVDARIELDLRIGAIFTRFQSLFLKPKFQELQEQKVLSYGPCQFPTLGFVVDRYLKAKNFVPEPFWYLDAHVAKEGIKTNFTWSRNRIYDQQIAKSFFDTCLADPIATITKVDSHPKSKWAPLPLTTVEMQKIGSRNLKISSDRLMHIAEKLYNEGIISYPRTETDVFSTNFHLRPLIEKQTFDDTWGAYATQLLQGGFRHPRAGKNNDEAHPPIHPVRAANNLTGDEKKLYDFIARRFLACVSHDAKGHETKVFVDIANEEFHAKGLVILERNYLDIYPFENWNASNIAPFSVGDTILADIALKQGETSKPTLLTEADLIGLMDKSGIGTDATIHEHIKKILERDYANKDGDYFVPTVLGMSLVSGYDKMEIDISLSKPELRALMEQNMKMISMGQKSKQQVIDEVSEMYRRAFHTAQNQVDTLVSSCSEFMTPIPLDQQQQQNPQRDMGVFVRHCYLCSCDMHLKEINSGKKVIGCSGYPACKESKWIPDCVFEINVLQDRNCPHCSTGPRMQVKMVHLKFNRNSYPMHIQNDQICCLFCNQDIVDFLFPNHRSRNTGPAPQSTKNMTAPQQPMIQPPVIVQQTRQTFDDPSFNNTNTDTNLPNCTCGQMAVQRTSKTEKTAGRVFYACAKSQSDSTKCDYFQWSDAPAFSSMQQQQQPTMSASHSNYNMPNTTEPTNRPRCECNLVAAIKTSTKDNENKGRSFATCPKSGAKCKFFAWLDENGQAIITATGPSSRSFDMSNATCYKCGEVGHFSSACSNQASTSFVKPKSKRGGKKKY